MFQNEFIQISTPVVSDRIRTMVSVGSGMDVIAVAIPDRGRSTSSTSRTPNHSPRLGPSRLSSSRTSHSSSSSSSSSLWLWYRRKRAKVLLVLIALLASFFFVNWFMLLRLQHQQEHHRPHPILKPSLRSSLSLSLQVFLLLLLLLLLLYYLIASSVFLIL